MNNKTQWHVVGQGAAILLGLIFLVASFSKIGDLADFHQSLDKLRFLPVWGGGLVTLLVPGLELTLGLCLLSRMARREAVFVAGALLLVFLGLSVEASLAGTTSSCNCFKLPTPSWLTLQGWGIVARNVALLGLSGVAWFCGKNYQAPEEDG